MEKLCFVKMRLEIVFLKIHGLHYRKIHNGGKIKMCIKCAWCGNTIGYTAPLAEDKISHGMCNACAELYVKQLDKEQSKINKKKT